MRKPIIVIVGGQWGSESKGMCASALGRQRGVRWAVRTGAVNAGHSVIYHGKKYNMQQLPCGWTHQSTMLVLGAGAFINPDILQREVESVAMATGESVARVLDRIAVDYRASTHTGAHTAASGASGRHVRMGATGKGCSEALVDKIRNRADGYRLFRDTIAGRAGGYNFCDTNRLLNSAYDGGEQILLEGTQGAMLDLHLGPYPFTTHKQTQAAQWIGEAGLSPSLEYEVVLVVRTMPIRVAGNSGPMPNETDWPRVMRGINRRLERMGEGARVREEAIKEYEAALAGVLLNDYGLAVEEVGPMQLWSGGERERRREALSEAPTQALKSLSEETQQELGKVMEFTTVTKKVRRVAEVDYPGLREAVRWNRPAYLVVTFMNYLFPELWGKEVPVAEERTVRGVKEWIGGLEEETRVRVGYWSSGPGDECLHRAPGWAGLWEGQGQGDGYGEGRAAGVGARSMGLPPDYDLETDTSS